jgi:hypothetical protein
LNKCVMAADMWWRIAAGFIDRNVDRNVRR